jgi:transposase-like protein
VGKLYNKGAYYPKKEFESWLARLHIYENFTDLLEKEQHHLFEAIKETLFPVPKFQGLLDDIREAKFSNGLACLHCGSLSVKRNGKYRDHQHYLYDRNADGGTHRPNLWLKYFELMIEGYNLPKIVDRLDIHISTAFYLTIFEFNKYNTHKGKNILVMTNVSLPLIAWLVKT